MVVRDYAVPAFESAEIILKTDEGNPPIERVIEVTDPQPD
jgi:hypothetical protein